MRSCHRVVVIVVTAVCVILTTTTVHRLSFSSLVSVNDGGDIHSGSTRAAVGPSAESVTTTANPLTDLEIATSTLTQSHSQLVWTSLQNGKDKNTTFFSAHYEMRKNTPLSGAVTVLGYHMKSLKDLKLYCALTYTNKSSVCITEPLEQKKLVLVGLDGDKIATSHMYVCRLKCRRSECSEDEIPLTVAISKNTDCTDASAEIPVVNRQPPDESEKKMLGVCVQGPVYGTTSLQKIVEFIEMNRALGVEIVTLYVMEMQKETWQFLEDHYVKQGHLRLLRWKKVEKWKPLHYFGQPVLLQDCLYRNMHRTKYLAIHDLDELLLPKKHNTLLELINSINSRDNYHSYEFGNCFYVENKEDSNHTVPCDKMSVPKYFMKTNRLKCYCFDKSAHRKKYMVQTELAVELCNHGLCRYTSGKSYYIPHSLAVNAHYRSPIPDDCGDKTITHDTAAFRHRSVVMDAIGERVCPSSPSRVESRVQN